MNPYYTLAVWRVRPGKEDEFKAAWRDLAKTFARLPHPPARGTLVQSLADKSLFYSFGPWPRLEDIEAMHQNPIAQEAFRVIRTFCNEATLGDFRVIEEMETK